MMTDQKNAAFYEANAKYSFASTWCRSNGVTLCKQKALLETRPQLNAKRLRLVELIINMWKRQLMEGCLSVKIGFSRTPAWVLCQLAFESR